MRFNFFHKMFFYAITLFLIVSNLISCSKNSTNPNEDSISIYYELKTGKFWDYKKYNKSGQVIYSWRETVVGIYDQAKEIYIYDTDGHKSYLGWEEDGFYSYGDQEEINLENPVRIFPRYVKKGEKYPGLIKNGEIEITDIAKSINTPAGEFKCVEAVERVNGRIIARRYIAPKVGMVFWEEYNQETGEKESYSYLIDYGEQQILFSARFSGNWLPDGVDDGILFINDQQGNIIASSTFKNNSNIYLFANSNNAQLSGKFTITTVYFNPKWNEVKLITNFDVKLKEMTWKGYPDYKSVGSVFLDFTNVPDHNGFIISNSAGGYRWSSTGTISSTTMNIFVNPENIFIKLNKNNGLPGYLWLNNVSPGNSYTVDLSNLKSMTAKEIKINDLTFKGYYYKITAFPIPGEHYNKMYMVDGGFNNDYSMNSLNIYYPFANFSDYKTIIILYNDFTTLGSKNYYFYLKYGDLPATFKKIDANFYFLNVENYGFQIQTSGNFDQVYAKFTWQDNNRLKYVWNIYGPPEKLTYSLPELPDLIFERFPLINRTNFSLDFVQLIDHVSMNSYDDIIDTYFNNLNYFYNIVKETMIISKAP